MAAAGLGSFLGAQVALRHQELLREGAGVIVAEGESGMGGAMGAGGPVGEPEDVRQAVLDRGRRQHQAELGGHLADAFANQGVLALELDALVGHDHGEGVGAEVGQRGGIDALDGAVGAALVTGLADVDGHGDVGDGDQPPGDAAALVAGEIPDGDLAGGDGLVGEVLEDVEGLIQIHLEVFVGVLPHGEPMVTEVRERFIGTGHEPGVVPLATIAAPAIELLQVALGEVEQLEHGDGVRDVQLRERRDAVAGELGVGGEV